MSGICPINAVTRLSCAQQAYPKVTALAAAGSSTAWACKICGPVFEQLMEFACEPRRVFDASLNV